MLEVLLRGGFLLGSSHRLVLGLITDGNDLSVGGTQPS